MSEPPRGDHSRRRLYSRSGAPIEWYYRLVPFSQTPSLLGDVTISEDSVIVSVELESDWKSKSTRRFTAFDTLYHLSTWMDDVPSARRTCFEVATDDRPRKPYFDIDLKAEDAIDCGHDYTKISKDVAAFAKTAASIAGAHATAMVCASSTPTDAKYSFHIILQGVQASTGAEARAFAEFCSERAPASIRHAIDLEVYSKTQQFRILHNRKLGCGDTRVKRFAPDLSTYAPSSLFKQVGLIVFRDSLITHTNGCDSIAVFVAPAPQSLRRREVVTATFTPSIESDAVAWDALDAVKDHFTKNKIAFPFSVRSELEPVSAVREDGSFKIELSRQSPSWCTVCKRTHEAENPFVAVKPSENTAMFFCGRSRNVGIPISLGETPEGILRAPSIVSKSDDGAETVKPAPKPKPKVAPKPKPKVEKAPGEKRVRSAGFALGVSLRRMNKTIDQFEI